MSLALAGLCFQQASAQGIVHPMGTQSTRSIGDSATGNSGGLTRPVQFQASRNLSDDSVGYAAAQQESAPPSGTTGYEQSHMTGGSNSSHYVESYSQPAGYGYSSYGQYDDGGYYGSSNRSPQVWFNSETLLWFSKNVSSPALINTSGYGVLPVTGAAGVTTEFGGSDGIDYGLSPGFRYSAGMYFGPEQRVGIGGRAYGLINEHKSYSQASDGSGTAGNPSIGIPFYNSSINENDAFLVAYQNGIDPDLSGTVTARSDLDMYGADGSLYLLLTRSDSMRMDLLGGYTYNLLKNSIGIQTTGVPALTATNDLFETKNVFNGAHLGVLSSVNRNRVSFSTLAKIAFGNMQQSGSARGFTNLSPDASILAMPSNSGEYSRDTFAFMPELGIKLGYSARENVQFTVGYTMMMWSDVALAGSQIDNVVDALNVTRTRPEPLFATDTFWMQGVDLGVTLAF